VVDTVVRRRERRRRGCALGEAVDMYWNNRPQKIRMGKQDETKETGEKKIVAAVKEKMEIRSLLLKKSLAREGLG
jgi:hypothetical protein